jgi:hypothetical protein
MGNIPFALACQRFIPQMESYSHAAQIYALNFSSVWRRLRFREEKTWNTLNRYNSACQRQPSERGR